MGRQTGRPSFRAVRRRKYIARRIMVIICGQGDAERRRNANA